MYSSQMFMAVGILVGSYILLFTEKLNRAIVAILGTALMIFAGILTQESALAAIDFNTLALLIGMMTIVGIGEQSGMFEYAAVKSVQFSKADPRSLMVTLALITAVFSAFLDNVTTVLLMVPIILQITKQLKIPAHPFLLMEIFASNIGGTATLIGDPPNILIGSALNIPFMDFIYNLTPVVIVVMALLLIGLDFIWGRKLNAEENDKMKIMQTNARNAIKDPDVAIKSLVVLFLVISGFVVGEHYHITHGTIAMTGAAVLLALYTLDNNKLHREHKVEEAFKLVDWTTIFFFAGLFALVFGLEKTGALMPLADFFINFVEGDIYTATFSMLAFSMVASAVLGNIPFVATIIPLLKTVEDSLGGREVMMPVWWALSLGACFGGNGTLIAASANVIVAGHASKEGIDINFKKFLIYSIPTTIISTLAAATYLLLRYF